MRKENSFVGDILTLSSAPIVSQILGILVTPIITRMFAPEAFGLATIFGSIVMIPAALATMGYSAAIILPKSDSEAKRILLICFISTTLISLGTFFIILISKNYIAEALNSPDLLKYLWLSPFFVFLHGAYMSLRFWKARNMNFKNIVASRISEILAKKGYQISAGFSGFTGSGSLIYSDLFSGILKVLILTKGLTSDIFNLPKNAYKKLINSALAYKKFPQFSVWSDLLSRLPAVIISIFIIKYFGQDALGNYGLSLMILSIPSVIFSSAIIEAFSPRVAMAKYENQHTELLENLLIRVFSITSFPFILLAMYSDELLPFVFSSEWATAGVITQILALKIFFEILMGPILPVIDVINKQELHLIRMSLSVIISLCAWFIAIYLNNFYAVLWFIVIMESLVMLFISVYILKSVQFNFSKNLLYAFKCISMCSLLAFPLILMEIFLSLSMAQIFLVILISLFLYLIFLFFSDEEIRQFIKNLHT